MSILSHPIGTRYKITPVDNGTICIIGDVSPTECGFWRIHFVPDVSFVGAGISILGRGAPGGRAENALDDPGEMNFGSVPYRRWQIGGVASDGALVQTSAVGVPLTQDALIFVPASGLTIAVSPDITAGFAYLYSQPILGHPGF